ncbi:hypothetical protein K4A07_16860, partial [Lactiplantibacillus plantarum]|nr:hypothetical protein [Lactiplantibacillus plantarum]
MGVKFDRILDAYDAPLERVPDLIATPPGRLSGRGQAGFVVDHAPVNGFILTNRLLKAGQPVFWLRQPTRADGRMLDPGALWIPASDASSALVRKAVDDLGLNAEAVDAKPGGEAIALKPIRVGLVDRYGGSMSAGWTRWLLEQFEFPFEAVYP